MKPATEDPKKWEHRRRSKLRCEFCDKQSGFLDVEMKYPKLPNTLTDMDDITTVIWKCNHCGCWQ